MFSKSSSSKFLKIVEFNDLIRVCVSTNDSQINFCTYLGEAHRYSSHDQVESAPSVCHSGKTGQIEETNEQIGEVHCGWHSQTHRH